MNTSHPIPTVQMALVATLSIAFGVAAGLALSPATQSQQLYAPAATLQRPTATVMGPTFGGVAARPQTSAYASARPVTSIGPAEQAELPAADEWAWEPVAAQAPLSKGWYAVALSSFLLIPVMMARAWRRSAETQALLPQWTMAATDGEGDDVVETEWKEVKKDSSKDQSSSEPTSGPGVGGKDEFDYLKYNDPLAATSRFIGRRFGLAGGLAFVGIIAAVEGNEILQAVLTPDAYDGNGEIITTPSGLQYVDVRIGGGQVTPAKGYLVGGNYRVSTEDGIELYNTKAPGGKPLAFKYQERPLVGLICPGVEEGVAGMRQGGVRRITVPPSLGFGDVPKNLPGGVTVPPGSTLIYEIEVVDIVPFYT